jgi:hypothetical protein
MMDVTVAMGLSLSEHRGLNSVKAFAMPELSKHFQLKCNWKTSTMSTCRRVGNTPPGQML